MRWCGPILKCKIMRIVYEVSTWEVYMLIFPFRSSSSGSELCPCRRSLRWLEPCRCRHPVLREFAIWATVVWSLKMVLSPTHTPVRREIGLPWRVREFTLTRDQKGLTGYSAMLLVCVWLLWNRDRRVGATLFILLVTCVSLGTGLRNTKPVRPPVKFSPVLYSPIL